MKLKENDIISSADVYVLQSGEPIKKDIIEVIKNKKVILFGLPGAYTSVCSAKHLPGYINTYEAFKAKGVDHIICISANDPFVMDAWGKSQNVEDKIIMIGDPFLNFTKSIGAEVDKSSRGLGVRSNRYTMLIENLKVVKLQEEKDAGACEISAAQNFLNLV
jgi:peroxiredoxin (alkyl hydroperoxide reductase subunit C)